MNSMRSHEQLIEEKAQSMGGLTGHQREVWRKYLEQGDKENHRDYLPEDEGEVNKGNIE